MKIVYLILGITFLVSLQGNGQDLYLWAGDKKIYLTADSSDLLITFKLSNLKSKILNTLSSGDIKLNKNDHFQNAISGQISSKNKQADISRIRQISGVENVFIAHYSGKNKIIVTNEIVFKPKKQSQNEKIIEKYSEFIIRHTSAGFNYFVLTVINSSKAIEIANELHESGLTEWAFPNHWVQIKKQQNDPIYPNQYYLNNNGQFNGTPGVDINAFEAWGITTGVNQVRVAVIDDGVENHEDIDGRVLPGFSSNIQGGLGAPIVNPPGVQIGHGQACAGIIAATINNNLGISGIAPCSQIIPVNIFTNWTLDGSGNVIFTNTALDIAAAIDWAWQVGEADILSNSWSYGTTDPNNVINAPAIITAINNARTNGRAGLGCLVTFASGNSNQNFSGITFPANVDGVITVGAIDRNGNIWNYSSQGVQMDLVAPSGDVNLAGDVRTIDRMGANGYDQGNYMDNFGGTSAACPQVSGIAALLLSVNPNLTEVQLANVLRNTATDMGSNGFDNTFGFGRVNAHAALQQVLPTFNQYLVCDATVLSLSYIIPGTTINWTSNNESAISINPGTGEAIIQNDFRGLVTIKVSMNGNCGSLILSQSLWLGRPADSYLELSDPFCDNEFSMKAKTFSASAYSPDASFAWSVASDGTAFISPGYDESYYEFYSSPTYVDAIVDITNACGTTNTWRRYFVTWCGGARITTFPNPARSEININIEVDESELLSKENKQIKVQLYDEHMNKLHDQTYSEFKITISTQSFKPGNYHLIIQHDEQTTKQQIVINK